MEQNNKNTPKVSFKLEQNKPRFWTKLEHKITFNLDHYKCALHYPLHMGRPLLPSFNLEPVEPFGHPDCVEDV